MDVPLYFDNKFQFTDFQRERTTETSTEEVRGSCACPEKRFTRQVT